MEVSNRANAKYHKILVAHCFQVATICWYFRFARFQTLIDLNFWSIITSKQMNNYSVTVLWARNLKKMKIKRNARVSLAVVTVSLISSHFLIAFRVNVNNILRSVRQDARKRSFFNILFIVRAYCRVNWNTPIWPKGDFDKNYF